MVDPSIAVGIALLGVGLILLGVEFVHPGALLFIPSGILISAGILYIVVGGILDVWFGPIVVAAVAVAAGLAEIPYYRHVAPTHAPMTSIPTSLVGREGIVLSDVVPDTLRGKVRVDSEIWSARAPILIPVGTRVRVLGGEGVAIFVTPVEAAAGSPARA